MRKIMCTFSLLAALICAATSTAFAYRAPMQQMRSRQNYGRLKNYGIRNYGIRNYGAEHYGRDNYRGENFLRQQEQRQQRQYMYGSQWSGVGRGGHDGRYRHEPRGRYDRGFGDVRDFGRFHEGRRYYGDHFVGIGIDDWGVYGYPYPFLFSDCYAGDWIFTVPSRRRWSVRVRMLDYDGYPEVVIAYWDPYLGGYYYYDPDMGYIEVLD